MSIIGGLFGSTDSSVAYVIGGLVILALSISAWAVAAQRCRDFGWTGWATLIILIPVIGFFFSLALLFIPGDVGSNRYGPDQLGSPAA